MRTHLQLQYRKFRRNFLQGSLLLFFTGLIPLTSECDGGAHAGDHHRYQETHYESTTERTTIELRSSIGPSTSDRERLAIAGPGERSSGAIAKVLDVFEFLCVDGGG